MESTRYPSKATHVRLLTQAIWYSLRQQSEFFTPYTVVLTYQPR